jgi:hypothetical protein
LPRLSQPHSTTLLYLKRYEMRYEAKRIANHRECVYLG